MAIEKRIGRDGKPLYYVRFDTHDPITGARKRHRVPGSFTSKEAAKKAERSAMVKRDQGTVLEPDKITVAQLCDEWLKHKAASVSGNTLADYKSVIETHIKPALGAVPVQKLNPATLQAQYHAWTTKPITRRHTPAAAVVDGETATPPRNISARTVRGCHMRLSQVLDYAVKMKIILHNPAKDATPPRLERAAFDHWDTNEARQFLAEAAKDSLHPLWHVLIREGMRRGEALGLRWRDINWEAGTAHVSQTVVHDKSKRGATLVQPRTKTKAGARTVHLTAGTLAELKLLRDRRTLAGNPATKPTAEALIFSTGEGKPVNPANITRNYNRIVAAAKVRRIKVHELRHTSASLALLAGIPAKVVSERLGHASVAITMDLYSHVLPSMQTDAAAAMDRLLG